MYIMLGCDQLYIATPVGICRFTHKILSYALTLLHFRKKLKLSLEDLENDDSSSDGEWKESDFKKAKRQKLSYTRHNVKQSSNNLMETAIKTRILPRRAVTLKTKSIIDTNQDDSEDDNDNIE